MSPPFVYQPVSYPMAQTIPAIIEQGGQQQAQALQQAAAARAAGQVGAAQAWSQAIGTLGQIGANYPEQQAKLQEAQLRMQEAKQKQQDMQALDKAFTVPAGTDPASWQDQVLSQIPGHLRPQVEDYFDQQATRKATLSEAQIKAELARSEYIYTAGTDIQTHNYDPMWAQAHLTDLKQTFAKDPILLGQIKQIEGAIQANPTPEGVQGVVEPYIKAYQSRQPPIEVPRGGKLINRFTGAVIATGTPAPMSMGELRQDAATVGTDHETPTAKDSLKALQMGGGGNEAALASDAATVGTPDETPTAKRSAAALKLLKPPATGFSGEMEAALIAAGWDPKTGERPTPAQATSALARMKPPVGQTFSGESEIALMAAGWVPGTTPTAAQTQAALKSLKPDQDVASTKRQEQLEQQYRTAIMQRLGVRGGALGQEDLKVQAINHALSLMEQVYDPRDGAWHPSTTQANEIAIAMANALAPGGRMGVELEREVKQATLKGDLARVLTYVTGTPVTGSTQDVLKMYWDSLQRQGQTSVTNRENEMNFVRKNAPTDLEPRRRQLLEAAQLAPLRQQKVLRDPKSGERRLYVSTDGGTTWQAQRLPQ